MEGSLHYWDSPEVVAVSINREDVCAEVGAEEFGAHSDAV